MILIDDSVGRKSLHASRPGRNERGCIGFLRDRYALAHRPGSPRYQSARRISYHVNRFIVHHTVRLAANLHRHIHGQGQSAGLCQPAIFGGRQLSQRDTYPSAAPSRNARRRPARRFADYHWVSPALCQPRADHQTFASLLIARGPPGDSGKPMHSLSL